MLLSVCMVVRDKSKTISRTINSVKKIADEVILIDLDSLDNTRVIARKVGAKVYHLNRKTDFYQSRNIAREKARGKWVLFLEGDEELIDDYQQLRVILRNTDIDGFYLPVVNFKRFKYNGKEVEDEFPFPYLSFRLYKNNKRYFYSKDTYESITNSILKINGEASLKVLHLPIVKRLNCSLIPGETQLYSWNLNDLELLADNNISPYFKEAIKRIRQEDYEQAIRRLEEAYSLTRGYDRLSILENLILALLGNKQYQRAEKIVEMALAIYPDIIIFKFWKGYTEYIKGNYRNASTCFKKIISGYSRDIEEKVLVNSYLFLGLSLITNNKKEAEFYLEKAFCYDRENRTIVNSLMEVKELTTTNLYNYFQLDNPENKNILLIILECLFSRKRYQLIEELISKQQIIKKNDNTLVYWQGLVLLKQKKYELSAKQFKNITPDFIKYRQVLHLQWILNLLIPGRPESKSIVNQLKLLGDQIDWNLVNYFNRIYFYKHRVIIRFDNLVVKLKFYTHLLYFLDLFIEFNFSEGISILQEIIAGLKLPGTNNDLGILFYIHGFWEKAYEFLKASIKEGESLPELSLLAEICKRKGKYTEEKKWREKSEYLGFSGEINPYCRNSVFLSNSRKDINR